MATENKGLTALGEPGNVIPDVYDVSTKNFFLMIKL